MNLNLDPRTTALVLIDLQNGIIGRPLAPRTGTDVVQVATSLAARFREAGACVVLVNVAWAKDFGDVLRQPVDKPFVRPPGGLPESWNELVDGLAQPTDIRVFGRLPVRRSPLENAFDLLSLFLYAGLVGAVQTVQLHYRTKERERRAEALEAQLTAARLSALQAQLHTHFLFNALNAISTLLVRDARAARDTLASFSTLGGDRRHRHPGQSAAAGHHQGEGQGAGHRLRQQSAPTEWV